MQFYKYLAGRRVLSILARASETSAFWGDGFVRIAAGKRGKDRRKTDRNNAMTLRFWRVSHC